MKRILLMFFALFILLAMMVVASSPRPVQAIDPTLDAAIGVIIRATAQEQERRNSISATRAALSAQVTSVAVEATRQAGYAKATAQAQEMSDLATRRSSDATATQQARDAGATATANAQSVLVTQAYNSALSTRQSGDATATVNAVYANATATISVMKVQATAEFIAGQQQASKRDGYMLTAGICIGLFIIVLVGWRAIAYFRQAQDTMASHTVKREDVIEPAQPLKEIVVPETIVVNDPDAMETWETILGVNQ